jgi:hypothetical protein
MNRLKRAVRALAAGSVITGGIVLGIAGVASAHQNIVSGNTSCQAIVGSATWTATWTVTNDYNLTETASVHTSTGGGMLVGLPALIGKLGHITVTQSGIPITTTSATLSVHGSWSDEFSTNSELATVYKPEGCIPLVPPPVAPSVTITPHASVSCGDFTVPLTVSVGDGENLVGNDGQTTVTFGTPVSPAAVIVSPGDSGSTSAVFPSSDAGKSETIDAAVEQVGFEGTGSLSTIVQLPDVCTTTVTTPAPPPVTITVPVPGPTTVITVPCSSTFNAGDGFTGQYNGPCPTAAPMAPAPASAAPAAVTPVGAPQTGFGGAAQSSNHDGLLFAGGGLILFGLLSVLVLLGIRKRDA